MRGRHYACLSEAIGVTCINLDKTEGFFLHRGEYVIFNAGWGVADPSFPGTRDV